MSSGIIFELNTSCGFFSVFFFLCKGYIYAKKNNIPFYITYNNWSYDGGEGWHGYFTTLDEIPSDIDKTKYIMSKHGKNVSHIIRYSLQEYENAIKEIIQFQPYIIQSAKEYIENVIGGDYISIYIRRGDKFTETQFISEEAILNKIKSNGSYTIDNKTKFFIQTDDYTVIENMRKLMPDNKIFYLVSESKRGHYQSKIYIKRQDDKNKHKDSQISFNDVTDKTFIKNDTTELLTSILISSKAKECWVDYSSNVGRFIKLFSPENTKSYDNVVYNKNKLADPYYKW